VKIENRAKPPFFTTHNFNRHPTDGHAAMSSESTTSRDVAASYTGMVVKPRTRELLSLFVTANEDPNKSENYRSQEPDEIKVFLNMLMSCESSDPSLQLQLLKAFKILSRKASNRTLMGNDGCILAILLHLSSSPLSPTTSPTSTAPETPPISRSTIKAEGANVLLNLCYEPQNVSTLINRTPGCRLLIDFLLEEDAALQANAAGAIQSICFTKEGRKSVRDLEGIQNLIPLLGKPDTKVVQRSVGALHNLSADGESISFIRRYGGIPRLIALLKEDSPLISGSAAGAIQNVGRELASRMLIREMDDVIEPLARLLSSEDMNAQVCAAGALLNLLGPELEGKDRAALGKIMSLVMASSMVYEGVYERRPEVT
jgi:hypothetical protein